MNCKQAEELLPLYAGRELEEKRATLVSEHVQTCLACARVADEYRESIHLTEQFAPPIFSEAVYAGVRQRVLRQIETEPRWTQTIASFFRPRLAWAIAGMLLIAVSLFAFYVVVNKGDREQQFAAKPPEKVQPEAKAPSNSGQQLAGVPRPRAKRSRDTASTNRVAAKTRNLPEPTLFPPRDSAALVETLKVEIQTKDPKIRIIWFVQTSKGT